MKRALLVSDGYNWYIRRVRVSVHDLVSDEMIYRCDKHLAGPFPTYEEAVKHMPKSYRKTKKAITLKIERPDEN
jgi:hypothetical protein